jgi:hypothetical protein
MSKAVFTTKTDPTYDDLPEFRYHFPRTYLRQVQAAVGDWITYYEPRRTSGDLSSRGGRQAYFAVARLYRSSRIRPFSIISMPLFLISSSSIARYPLGRQPLLRGSPAAHRRWYQQRSFRPHSAFDFGDGV